MTGYGYLGIGHLSSSAVLWMWYENRLHTYETTRPGKARHGEELRRPHDCRRSAAGRYDPDLNCISVGLCNGYGTTEDGATVIPLPLINALMDRWPDANIEICSGLNRRIA